MLRFTYILTTLLLIAGIVTAQPALEDAFPALSFDRPVDLQHAGDGSNRLFVVEQAGMIYVFANESTVPSASLFLDIKGKVNDEGNEEGLLGLAFHPSYRTNGYFYLNYTAASPRRTVISRFTVSQTDANAADPNSELILMEFAQPFSNHNGGQIAFGPDGYLYIATGDGGSGGDPQNNSQNRASLLGKILRIDVDAPSAGKNYGIPADNPYVNNDAGFREEIWAYGLRNPWRFSFDPVTGRLWTADVGQNRFEEIDIIERGGNYGWRIMEGFACYNPSSGCDTTGLVKPLVTYERSLGVSVTGGHVYRGSSVPELTGLYLYADFVSGRLWSLLYEGPGKVTNTLLLSTGQNISSFGVDEFQETYICTFGGSILKFTPTVTGIDALPLPAALDIETVHPQPALRSLHGSASVRIGVPHTAAIRLSLHDTLGREVRVITAGNYSGGWHTVTFNLNSLSPGVYFLALTTPDSRAAKKFLVME